jgi:hypothetical protein
MRSSGITLIAEERAAKRHRACRRALEWVVAASLILGAIYGADAIRLYIENQAQHHQLVQR